MHNVEMKRKNNELEARINELKKKAQDSVHRTAPAPDVVAKAEKQIINDVTYELREGLAKVRAANELSNAFLAPSLETLKQDKNGAAKFSALRNAHKAAEASQARRSQNHHSNLAETLKDFVAVGSGYTFSAPPWDRSWEIPNDSTQFVQGFTDTEGGMSVSCLGSNDANSGFGAAGYGIFFSSPISRAISIRPFMPCDYNHKEWSYTFSANSRGGFGVRVYDGSANVVPNTDLRPVLWDQTTNGAQEPPRNYGDNYLQNLLSNGEIAFTMNAGETYQIWLWIWGHADQSGEVLGTFGDPFGSFTDFGLSATLPWITFFS